MPVEIITKDLGWKKIEKTFKGAGVSLTVGIHGSAGSQEVLIGTVHEFGSPERGIPERSFMRSTFNTKREELYEQMEKAIADGFRGVRLDRSLGRIGLGMVAAIQATIRNRETVGPEPQANKPATIARKGSDTPLIDTGRLIASITSVVSTK